MPPTADLKYYVVFGKVGSIEQQTLRLGPRITDGRQNRKAPSHVTGAGVGQRGEGWRLRPPHRTGAGRQRAYIYERACARRIGEALYTQQEQMQQSTGGTHTRQLSFVRKQPCCCCCCCFYVCFARYFYLLMMMSSQLSLSLSHLSQHPRVRHTPNQVGVLLRAEYLQVRGGVTLEPRVLLDVPD